MKTARERVLDEVHLQANAQIMVVAALEAGVDKERLLRLIETAWDDTVETAKDADEVEAKLHAPNERPL